MLGTLAQWIACLFVCMALGCSSVERQIRSTSNAEHITGAPFHREVASSAPDANFENQRVRQAGFSDASFVDSTEVKPASVEVVDGDPVITAEAPASGASLEELLSLAFANNPAIKELAATTQIAAGYRTQVGLYANPMVGYQGQQLADAGTDQHLLFVQQQIITGNKLALNRAVLNEALRAQLQELEAQKLRVTTDIKTVYYDSVRIQQQLSAIEQFSTLLKQGSTRRRNECRQAKDRRLTYCRLRCS